MVPSMSQIRSLDGKKPGGKDNRAEDYNRSLKLGLEQYRKEKTPELKAQLSSQWRMASQQGVQIDKKLSEQVKKIVRQDDSAHQPKDSSSLGSGPCGSAPCGSGPCSAEGSVGDLLGGLSGNFKPKA